MLPNELSRAETRVRALARARSGLFATLRMHLRSRWLQRTVEDLYELTAPASIAALSAENAKEIRETLERMQKDLAAISERIPFDRKLPVHLRRLTPTYQGLYRLRNATTNGIAAIALKLDGEVAVDITGLPFSENEIREVRERMLLHAPGWTHEGMGLYDQL